MSLYLYQNETRIGPFTEEQVRQMLQSATVTLDTLAWKEGLSDWRPLSGLLNVPPGQLPPPPPPPPKTASSYLSLASLISSLIVLVAWILVFVAIAIVQQSGPPGKAFNITIGLIFFAGLLVSFGSVIVGIIGIVQNKSRTLGIAGVCLSVFLMLSFVGLMILGMVAKSGHLPH